jgi:hypothetical protein
MIILVNEFIRLVFLFIRFLFSLLCWTYLTLGLGMLCWPGNRELIFIFNSISCGMTRADASSIMRLMSLFT